MQHSIQFRSILEYRQRASGVRVAEPQKKPRIIEKVTLITIF